MKLEQMLRESIRMQGKSSKTADVYWMWCKRFLLFARDKRGAWVHPSELRERHVEVWLKHIANVDDVSANTQNQAFSALCYLYRHVLKQPLENVSAFRAKRPDRVRDVLDQEELVQLFDQLTGIPLLVARMMYASSFRIGEVGDLRIKDISFQRRQIVVRGGKGEKDRIVGFPAILHEDVQRQIEAVRLIWQADVARKQNGVSLPHRFGIKSPRSRLDFAWYYFLPSDHYSRCPHTGTMYRHHIDMGNVARRIKEAALRCGFAKRVTSHVLRHSFATHSLENGVPIHVVQRLMGHTSIETTQGYLHMAKDGVSAAKSPLEQLLANPPQREKPADETPAKFRVVG
jgi:integron integrase